MTSALRGSRGLTFLNFLPSLQGAQKCDLIGILQLATNGDAVGQAGDLDLHRPQKAGDVHGTDVTADYYGIGSLGTRYFYYFDDAFRSSEVGKKVPLDLSAHSNGMVQGFGGYWWP